MTSISAITAIGDVFLSASLNVVTSIGAMTTIVSFTCQRVLMYMYVSVTAMLREAWLGFKTISALLR